MVTVECIESKKSDRHTNIQTNKQINQRRQKDYSRRATITNKQSDKRNKKTIDPDSVGAYNNIYMTG